MLWSRHLALHLTSVIVPQMSAFNVRYSALPAFCSIDSWVAILPQGTPSGAGTGYTWPSPPQVNASYPPALRPTNIRDATPEGGSHACISGWRPLRYARPCSTCFVPVTPTLLTYDSGCTPLSALAVTYYLAELTLNLFVLWLLSSIGHSETRISSFMHHRFCIQPSLLLILPGDLGTGKVFCGFVAKI